MLRSNSASAQEARSITNMFHDVHYLWIFGPLMATNIVEKYKKYS